MAYKLDLPVADMVRDYNAGMSALAVAERFGISERTVRGRFKENHIPLRQVGGALAGYNLDKEFFDVIDTETKAYWLGFIFADGCIIRKGQYVRGLAIGLQLRDKSHIVQFRDDISSTHPIYERKNAAIIRVHSARLAKGLGLHGVIPAKSYKLKFPQISSRLERHFIRGFADGDGCWTRNKGNLAFSFTSASKSFLETIQHKLKELNIASSLVWDQKCWKLCVGSKASIITLFRFLYAGSHRFLPRKLKWPQHFLGLRWVNDVIASDYSEYRQLCAI